MKVGGFIAAPLTHALYKKHPCLYLVARAHDDFAVISRQVAGKSSGGLAMQAFIMLQVYTHMHVPILGRSSGAALRDNLLNFFNWFASSKCESLLSADLLAALDVKNKFVSWDLALMKGMKDTAEWIGASLDIKLGINDNLLDVQLRREAWSKELFGVVDRVLNMAAAQHAPLTITDVTTDESNAADQLGSEVEYWLTGLIDVRLSFCIYPVSSSPRSIHHSQS